MNKDFYKILGVSDNASEADIKKAYRELAKKHHPDKHPNDTRNEERFKEISEAYNVLSNKEKRKQYDQLRKFGAGGFGGGANPNVNFHDFSSMFGGRQGQKTSGPDLGDLFSELFGGAGRGFSGRGGFRQSRVPGQDIKTEITIPFDLAVRGGKHMIMVNRTGSSRRLSINIPAGTEDNKVMRLSGQGEPSPNGGPKGNLYITIHVADHPVFKRNGLDLESKVTINVVQAILGSKVRVNTFDGNTVELKVPAGSKSGKKLRLKGMGVKLDGKVGDQIVELEIASPSKISEKGRKLLEQFAREEGITW